MSALAPTTAHRAARNQATLDLMDTGAGAARIDFYTAAAGTLLATRTLASPSGVINAAGRIELAQAAFTVDRSGDPMDALADTIGVLCGLAIVLTPWRDALLRMQGRLARDSRT